MSLSQEYSPDAGYVLLLRRIPSWSDPSPSPSLSAPVPFATPFAHRPSSSGHRSCLKRITWDVNINWLNSQLRTTWSTATVTTVSVYTSAVRKRHNSPHITSVVLSLLALIWHHTLLHVRSPLSNGQRLLTVFVSFLNSICWKRVLRLKG